MEFLSKYQLLELMDRFESNKKVSHSKIIFRYIKPYIVEEFEIALKTRKLSNRGTHRKLDLNQFLEIYFQELNSGTKISDLMEIYNWSSSNYYRYKAHFTDLGIAKIFFRKTLEVSRVYELKEGCLELSTDTSSALSKFGKEGVGYGYKFKGKRSLKFGLLINSEKIIYIINQMKIGPSKGNLDDRDNLRDLLDQNEDITLKGNLYADKGYIGEDITIKCFTKDLKLHAIPKRLRNGKPSHTLSPYYRLIAKRERPKVEHVNAQLKAFRGIATKYDSKLKYYHTKLFFASLLVNINNLCKNYLIPKMPLKIIPKIY